MSADPQQPELSMPPTGGMPPEDKPTEPACINTGGPPSPTPDAKFSTIVAGKADGPITLTFLQDMTSGPNGGAHDTLAVIKANNKLCAVRLPPNCSVSHGEVRQFTRVEFRPAASTPPQCASAFGTFACTNDTGNTLLETADLDQVRVDASADNIPLEQFNDQRFRTDAKRTYGIVGMLTSVEPNDKPKGPVAFLHMASGTHRLKVAAWGDPDSVINLSRPVMASRLPCFIVVQRSLRDYNNITYVNANFRDTMGCLTLAALPKRTLDKLLANTELPVPSVGPPACDTRLSGTYSNATLTADLSTQPVGTLRCELCGNPSMLRATGSDRLCGARGTDEAMCAGTNTHDGLFVSGTLTTHLGIPFQVAAFGDDVISSVYRTSLRDAIDGDSDQTVGDILSEPVKGTFTVHKGKVVAFHV